MHLGAPIAGGFVGTVSVNCAVAGCAASATAGLTSRVITGLWSLNRMAEATAAGKNK